MFKRVYFIQCSQKDKQVEIEEITEVLPNGNGADKKFIHRFCSDQNHCEFRTVCPAIK